MSTHNIGFYEDLTKIIIELSSNTHLISSSIIGLPSNRVVRRKPTNYRTLAIFEACHDFRRI